MHFYNSFFEKESRCDFEIPVIMKPVRAYVDHNYPFYGHMMKDLEGRNKKMWFCR